MNIHLRADECTSTHTRFTVFAEGKDCGTLCMLHSEAMDFHQILSLGCSPHDFDTFQSSGSWANPSRPSYAKGE